MVCPLSGGYFILFSPLADYYPPVPSSPDTIQHKMRSRFIPPTFFCSYA